MADDLNDLDRFMKESSRSYKECSAKNSARRNSLMKKTLGIEAEHRLAAAEISREEKQLRQHLKQMQIDREKSAIMHNLRDRPMSGRGKSKKSKENGSKAAVDEVGDSYHKHPDPMDPYPVTFPHGQPMRARASTMDTSHPMRSRANTLDNKGKAYAARRDRRESKEFEDLHLNTATGTLDISHRLLFRSSASRGTSPRSGTPQNLSPSMPRRRTGSNCSSSSVDSNGSGHWAGDPEAINSVRRPRKSVEEQKDRLLKKEMRLHGHQEEEDEGRHNGHQ